MLDQEALDYIKVQKSLGVNESSIKRSLIDAGHDPSEVEEAFRKSGKSMGLGLRRPRMTTTEEFLIGANVMVIVVVAVILLFVMNSQDEKFNELSGRIAGIESGLDSLNTSIGVSSEGVSQDIATQIGAVRSEITSLRATMQSGDEVLKSEIENYHYNSLRRDTALSVSMQQVANHSIAELALFQQEFANLKSSSVDFSKVIPKATKATVLIGEQKDVVIFNAAGSGAMISSAGYVVTNEHVVDDLNKITVKLSTGGEYSADVLAVDEKWDVALLKLRTPRKDFTYMEWADSDDVYVGQRIIAIGSPVGFESTVTEGIISNTNRRVTGEQIYYFQTDVAINQGNSGGPLVDKDGKIVGIATRKYMENGYEGLSFALKSNDVKKLVVQMMYDQEN